MARENKSKYALLGLLSSQPMSGYDIKNAYSKYLDEFWSESYGQIYPILNKLSAEGLATKSIEHQDGKPDRHVYTITDKGLEELKAWLLKPVDPDPIRFELLLKLSFGKHMPIEESIKHLEAFRQQQLDRLSRYVENEKTYPEQEPDKGELPYCMISIWCGQYVGRAFVDWCDEAIAYLKTIQKES